MRQNMACDRGGPSPLIPPPGPHQLPIRHKVFPPWRTRMPLPWLPSPHMLGFPIPACAGGGPPLPKWMPPPFATTVTSLCHYSLSVAFASTRIYFYLLHYIMKVTLLVTDTNLPRGLLKIHVRDKIMNIHKT